MSSITTAGAADYHLQQSVQLVKLLICLDIKQAEQPLSLS